jgi:hypothetical protein
METSTTYEVRILERDGNIRPYEFLDRSVAVLFAEHRSAEGEVIGFYKLIRTKEEWSRVA